MITTMNIEYVNLLDRVKAAVVDSILLIVFMYMCSEIFSLFESVPNVWRMAVFVFIFFLYDPIFTSVFGGTIGHSFMKITVKKEDNPEQNISFFAALLRFIFKAALGWISLLTTTGNSKRKAIHDYEAKSIVIYSEPIKKLTS